MTGESELRDCRGWVGQEPLLVRGVHPRSGDHAGAVSGTDLGFEGVDDEIERRPIHEPLLDQQRLERLDPQREIRRNRLVIVVVVLRVIAVVLMRLGCERCGAGGRGLQKVSPPDGILGMAHEAAPRIWGTARKLYNE